MISARQWAASKMRPQVYGERIDLNVTTTASITDALAAAAARVLPLRDPVNMVDVEVIETIEIINDGSTGSKPAGSDNEGNETSTE